MIEITRLGAIKEQRRGEKGSKAWPFFHLQPHGEGEGLCQVFQAWLASSLIAIALPSIARHLNVNRDASFPFGCIAMLKIKFAAILWQKQFEVFQYIFQASVPLLEEFVNYLSQWIHRTYMYACTQLCLCLRYVM